MEQSGMVWQTHDGGSSLQNRWEDLEAAASAKVLQLVSKFLASIGLSSKIENVEPWIFNKSSFDNSELKLELLRKSESAEFRQIFEVRKTLPVIQQSEDILRSLRTHQVTLVVGSNDCGKTTQIAQLLLDDYIFNYCGSGCRIACVQNRKSEAISAAQQVAYERVEDLGNSIGFWVGGRKVLPRDTASILYCTACILIKQFGSDPLLSSFSAVIIDIQEQSVEANLLMELLKTILPHRTNLQVILLATTVVEDSFCGYFKNYCVIFIQAKKISSELENETFRSFSDNDEMNGIDDIINISDSESSIEDEPINKCKTQKKRAQKVYRKSKAFLRKYNLKNSAAFSTREINLIKKHQQNIQKYERIYSRVVNLNRSKFTDSIKDECVESDSSVESIPATVTKRRRLSNAVVELQVAIIDHSDPHGRISDSMWLRLEEMLLDEMVCDKWNNERISFDGANWSRGNKLVTCGNIKSLEFLKNTIGYLGQFWPHTQLEVIPRSALPLRAFAKMWIPPPVPRAEVILTLIAKQNKMLDTNHWKIINVSESKKNSGRVFEMFIDGVSLNHLRKNNGRIKFGLNFIRIQLNEKKLI